MTSLIGTQLLGNTFVQDSNPNYIKINGVVLGNTQAFGYTSGKNTDIGVLLTLLLKDPKIVVVLYNWSSGNYYTKTGFNLSNTTDHSLSSSYTAFIVSSRVTPTMLGTTTVTPIAPTVTVTPVSSLKTLVGQTLLGNSFVTDTNTYWEKINGVTMGETYGYSSSTTKDIGSYLANMSDPNVVVVLYNWTSGAIYTKKGFNLSNTQDSKINVGWSSFVLESKIPAFTSGITPSSVPIVSPITSTSGFVTVSNGNFMLNGNTFYGAGLNCYWLALAEDYSYPTHEMIDEIFRAAVIMGANTIRSHTLGFSFGTQNSLLDPNGNFNNDAWEPIDYAFSVAAKNNIKLIILNTDCYDYYSNSYGFFTSLVGVDKTLFFTDAPSRVLFKNFINGYLNHVNQYTGIAIKNSPELMLIELGNEFDIRPSSNSNVIPTQEWLSDISSYIKSIDTNHLILCPSDESLGQSNEFSISTFDCYSGHFYWEDYNRMNNGAQSSANIGKPYIIGEYSSQFQQDWFTYIEQNPNIKGSYFWSIFGHSNGLSSGSRVIHSDGYSLYCDNQSAQNTQQLLLISNHYRRKLNLPQVTSLNF